MMPSDEISEIEWLVVVSVVTSQHEGYWFNPGWGFFV